MEWNPDGADAYGLNDITTLADWFEDDTEWGTKATVWTPNPSTLPRTSYWMDPEPEFRMSIAGPAESPVSVSLVELPPFFSAA